MSFMATSTKKIDLRVARWRALSSAPMMYDEGEPHPTPLIDASPCSPISHPASLTTPSVTIAYHEENNSPSLASSAGSFYPQPRLTRQSPTPHVASSHAHAAKNTVIPENINTGKLLPAATTDPSHLSPSPSVLTYSEKSKPRRRKRHRQDQQSKKHSCADIRRTFDDNNISCNSKNRTFVIKPSLPPEKIKSNKTSGGLFFILTMAAFFGIGGSNEVS